MWATDLLTIHLGTCYLLSSSSQWVSHFETYPPSEIVLMFIVAASMVITRSKQLRKKQLMLFHPQNSSNANLNYTEFPLHYQAAPAVVWSGCGGSDGVSINTSNKECSVSESFYIGTVLGYIMCPPIKGCEHWSYLWWLPLLGLMIIPFGLAKNYIFRSKPGWCGKEFEPWSFIFSSWYLQNKTKQNKVKMFNLERSISYLLGTLENARRAPRASRGLKIAGANGSYVELSSSFARPQQHADLLIGTPGAGQVLLASWAGNTGWQSQVASTKPLRPERHCNRQLAKPLQCFLGKHQP